MTPFLFDTVSQKTVFYGFPVAQTHTRPLRLILIANTTQNTPAAGFVISANNGALVQIEMWEQNQSYIINDICFDDLEIQVQ